MCVCAVLISCADAFSWLRSCVCAIPGEGKVCEVGSVFFRYFLFEDFLSLSWSRWAVFNL